MGKIWLVTGASAGLGKAVVEMLLTATPPEDVVIAAVRKPQELVSLLSLSDDCKPDKLHTVRLDLLDESTLQPVWDWVKERFGRIDCIISCAGTGGDVSEIEGLPRERIEEFFCVNFCASFRFLQAAVATFRQGGGFRVFQASPQNGHLGKRTATDVFNQVTSETAVHPYPGMAWYASSKAENLLGAYSKELSPEWNIKIHCIALGAFATRMSANLIYHPVHPAYVGTPMDLQIRPACRTLQWAPALRGAKDITDLAMGVFGEELPFHICVGADAAVMMRLQREEYDQSLQFYHRTIGRHTDN